jgi:aldehyde:ferredoxin oxidoreductase
VNEGPYGGTAGEGPEFETLCALGSRCGNSNLESILAANNLCNQYGLDTISTGGVIAFAMECYEKGLLSKSDADGLELDWGNHETMISLIHKIARREGVGDLLAEGIARMSEQIPGSEEFALHIKGLETPEQDVRGLKSWGLGWAVSSRGADHCRAFPLAETTWKPEEAERLFGTKNAADRFSYDGKPEMVKWYEEYSAVGDALEFCRIAQLGLNMPLELIAEIVNAVTGLEYTAEGLLEVGERIVQVERIFNLRNGLKPGDDRLPTRFLKEPIPSGPSKGHRYDQEKVIRKYYTLRDWDPETGWPGKNTLERLEITKKHLGIEH